jgi:tetratricopeptide (TPR) repeat protein
MKPSIASILTHVFLTVVLFTVPLSIFSQDKTLELAKSYEADGMYEKALSLYEKVYTADSNNLVILDRLKNIYKILDKNDSRLRIIRRQVAADSLNIVLLCELMDAYIRTKRTDEIEAVISRGIRVNPQSVISYRLLAGTLNENRMFDQAEKVYTLGRKNTGNEKLFVIEMANLYGYRGDVYSAVKEYLKYYHSEANAIDYVRSQILKFPENEKNSVSVIRGLKEDLALREDLRIQKLLIEIYLRSEDYEAAFEQSKIVDQRYGQKGVEVLNFAKTALDNALYPVAEKAYAYFLQLYPNAPQAEMGLARCLEKTDESQKLITDSTRTGQKVPENYLSSPAIRAYDAITKKYAHSEWSAEAFYHIGMIRLQKFFDVDEALNNFVKAAEVHSPYRMDALFAVAECGVMQGRLESALAQYKALAKESDDQGFEERALFALAETYFFAVKFDSSQAVFQYLSNKKEGLFVNDALGYKLLYLENKNKVDPLKMFAKAGLLARQRKFSEALAVLSDLIKNNPDSPIVDDALMEEGVILTQQKKYNNAIQVFESIALRMKDSPLADLAQKKIGEIYAEELSNPNEAIRAYKDLLVRFPKSIYSNPVRKKIRELEKSLRKSS